jgi:hypothetical protein
MDKPYTVHSPTKITLSAEAKFWAEQHGMTLAEMGHYLSNKEKLIDGESHVVEIF